MTAPVSERDTESGFRTAQKLAYACAQAIGADLQPGVTEQETAAAMRRWLEQRGVTAWFHLPFAWFGDRTAFRGVRLPHQFFPTDRRLEAGMPYILDCAPVVDGYTCDIGYTASLGSNPVVDLLLDDLAEHRALILAEIRKRTSLRRIYQAVDELAARQGYENRHQAYPFRVIAHQVPSHPIAGVHQATALHFGVASVATLVRTTAVGARNGWSPLWNGGRRSDHPPVAGLWAVEPHLGFRGVGAKFEELLVVTDTDAYWLDDDLPHVRP
jgi:Xaa-Pro aminopeptidase